LPVGQNQWTRRTSYPRSRGAGRRSYALYPTITASKSRIHGTDKRRPCYRGIRLNDEIAPKVYKVDHQMMRLGFEAHEALERDASGWPIVRTTAERDLPA
jgi:hypothetical protein